MESLNIAEKLKEIVIQNLVQTQYNESDNCEFQKQQIDSIFNKVNSIFECCPNLKDILHTDMQIVPPISEVGGIEHMQNIGSSANDYLEAIKSDNKGSSDDLREIVCIFLSMAEEQARGFCVDYEKKVTQESSHTIDLAYLEEYRHNFEAFIQDANAQLKKLRDETEAASSRAKSEAEMAKNHAEEAAKTAKKASESADKASKTSKKATSLLNNATSCANKAIRSAKDAQKNAEGIVPNMLTVLGIFVAIVIAVVACYLSILLTNQNTGSGQYTLPVLFMQYLLMGHIMIMVVFMLLYLVSKLTSRSITTRCSRFEVKTNPPKHIQKECDRCKYRCSALVRFRLQYTYIFTINLLFVVGYIYMGIWHIIDVYYQKEFDAWVDTHPIAVFSIILACLGMLLVLYWCVFHKKKANTST